MYSIDNILGMLVLVVAFGVLVRVALEVFFPVVVRKRLTRKQLKKNILDLEYELRKVLDSNWSYVLSSIKQSRQIRKLTDENKELRRVNAIHVDVAKQLDNDVEELRNDLSRQTENYRLLWSYYVSLCEDYYVAKSKLSRKPKNKAA